MMRQPPDQFEESLEELLSPFASAPPGPPFATSLGREGQWVGEESGIADGVSAVGEFEDQAEAPALPETFEKELEEEEPFATDRERGYEEPEEERSFDFEPAALEPQFEDESFGPDRFEAPYAEAEEEAPLAPNLRARVVEIAKKERDRWGSGTKSETDPAMHDVLRGYWETVLKRPAAERAIKDRSPWSAAFVSYVMRNAGAGQAFRYAAAHYAYVSAAKRWRVAGDSSKFWAYDVTEVKPEVGDVVCRDRQGRGGTCGGTTYANVDDGQYHPTHCDIVTEVGPSSISVIGGNVGGMACAKGSGCTANARSINLDARGFVVPSQGRCAFFAIVRPPGGPTVAVVPSGGGSVLMSLPRQLADAVRQGLISLQVALAIRSGQRDINMLTNVVFYAKHPELPVGYKIQPHEKALAQEWLRVRDQVIQPLLRIVSPAASPIASGPSAAPPTPGPQGPAAFGIDTASVAGNANPNWAEAKAQVPIDFAIIRSNYGTIPDRVFLRDWPKIKDAGIVRGAYLFLRFPHSKRGQPPDPVAQAEAFIKTVGSLDESDLPPALDVEFPGGRSETKMTARQLLDGVRDAWRALRDHYGVAPIIYTSARVWKEDLDNLPAPDLVESPLWLARYYFKPGPALYDARKFAGGHRNPPVPPPWGDATNWWIHQYQGDALKLPGFPTGNVDMNRFNIMIKGATGDRVKWVQRRLGIPQNGTFDAATETALRAFQDKKGSVADGVIDPRTFAYLCWSSPNA